MSRMDIINEFVDTMLEQQSQFENIQSSITRCENEVDQVISDLENTERRLVDSSRAKMGDNRDSDITNIFDVSSESLVHTITEVNQKIREAVKGMEFIQDFEKHFTVAVFGKVKAGKSYIGNFVMGNGIKKLGLPSSYDKLPPITVHVYDRGKVSTQDKLEEQPDDGDFATGMKETTSTIQWFDLGGLSWFDTPGIGSVTWENEMLAKEYVKNADLVIFACNSDAAGTRQEFSEMRQLYDMGKPILLLLTQSDTYEYDVDDEGEEISVLVPKSEKDRMDTEAYMIQTLQEQGMSEILKYDILTVSAKLGMEALAAGDEVLFSQSNMDRFLEKLIAITRNDAAAMKKATPGKRLNEMIDSIIQDLEEMARQITEVCRSAEESQMDLENRKDIILEQIKSQVYYEVLKIVQKFKTKVEQDHVSVSEEEMSEEIDAVIASCIQKVCMDEALKTTENIQRLEINLSGIGEMKMKQDKIAYEHVRVEQVQRDPRGFWEKAGALILNKTYYTSSSRTETRYSTFDIGVNDSDIAQNIMFKLEDIFRDVITSYIESIVDGYYRPIQELQTESVREIQKAVQRLDGLKLL